MKTFIVADIHGSHRGLLQCLQKSKFNYNEDQLICLGDTSDGQAETYQCFEELLKIKNLIYIRGNHDQWLKEWLDKGKTPNIWAFQGGLNTIESYKNVTKKDKKRHLDFLKKTVFYYIDDKNRCFVHGGIDPLIDPAKTDKMFLMWDRTMAQNPANDIYPQFKEIYIGHTSIWNRSDKPLHVGNIWMMDTGGGWEGKLSIMNLKTKIVWQSDLTYSLYSET